LAIASGVTAAAADPWAELAEGDVRAMHDALATNHPGPVDPQNPGYRDWLESGLKLSVQRAHEAQSLQDYERTLTFYANGFNDNHVAVSFHNAPRFDQWPGFVVGSVDGGVGVVYAEAGAGVAPGAKLLSCDGLDTDALLKARTDPYFWRTAVPHQRFERAFHLFYQAADDPQATLKTCVFSSGPVALKWQRFPDSRFQDILAKARGVATRPPSLRQIDGVWIVSIPTFGYQTDEEVTQIRGVIAAIEKNAPELRKSTVVFDVRGNGGGNSAWGNAIVKAFWGEAWEQRAEARSGGFVVDWRASPHNLAAVVAAEQQMGKAGLDTAQLQPIIAAIGKALREGKPLARVVDPSPKIDPAAPLDPVTGRVYFLADGACSSACLDFADLMHELPGVTPIGLPTGADTNYIDLAFVELPSGLARFGYGMKVYRDRVRGSNVWYEPKVRWPGGDMSDDAAIVRWIKSLS